MDDRTCISSVFCIVLILGTSSGAIAAGTGTGGRDVLHVPMAWCGMQGSPAVASPNITPEGASAPDTSTDAILWRRHERPTDNIFIPNADITLRSAIFNSWGSFNFPTINDTNTSVGQLGDVRGEANTVLGTGSEFAQAIINCDNAYAAIGQAGIGITAINVNLFHNAAGNYPGVLGWGGCSKNSLTNVCVNAGANPYNGIVVVTDNKYLYPTVADRTLPPSPADPAGNAQFGNSDPLDQLVGHEAAHALGLNHNNSSSNNLMFPSTQDNNGDGRTDNITLNAAEIATLRASALNVPGVEIDPPNVINPGNILGMRLPNQEKLRPTLDAHLAITSMAAHFDKQRAELLLSINLRGITPSRTGHVDRYIMGLDSIPDQKFTVEAFEKIGLPKGVLDEGDLDYVFIVDIEARRATGKAFKLEGRDIKDISDKVQFEHYRLEMEPYLSAFKGKDLPNLEIVPVGVFDTIAVRLGDKLSEVKQDVAFAVDSAATFNNRRFHKFTTNQEPAPTMVLRDPSYPHCFLQEPGLPGGEARVLVDGLLPSQPIHALVGADEVYKGRTDRKGTADFKLPIPKGARSGLHLVTIGIDETALTADCVVQVGDKG